MVSILMNCLNGEKFAEEAIKSVLAQTYTNWELIFIDDYSTDNTANIVKSFNDKRIKYYKTPYLMKLGDARVWAKDLINGDYFSMLDVDDLILPTKLEKQINIFKNHEDVGLIYSNSILFTNEKEHLIYKNIMPSGDIFKNIVRGYFFSSETLLVRRKILKDNNIFFTNNYEVCSDMEIFSKAAYFTKSIYINEPLAKWRYGTKSSVTDTRFALFPAENEQLLKDFEETIPDFNNKFKEELKERRAIINNMYGLSFYAQNNNKKAREYFKKASDFNLKYMLHYVLTFIFSYKSYESLRKLFNKTY